MTGTQLVELIGKPITDKKVQSMLDFFGYKEPKKGSYAGNIFEKEMSIAFLSRLSFDSQFTSPPHEFSREDYILTPFENPDLPQLIFILSEFSFNKEFKGELPFGLNWTVSKESIKKLGKSLGGGKNTEGIVVKNILKDPYHIQIGINSKDKLQWLTVMWVDNQTKKAQKLKETIKLQNKNISPAYADNVSKYLDKKPSTKWYDKLNDTPSFYTKESIDETDHVLTAFIENLVIATKEKKANKVLSSVKKVVLALNKLEDKYGHIETIEREELCPFILDAVKATGFKSDHDLTEEWRNW